MIYNCTCVGEKEIKAKNGKLYTLLWVALYDDKGDFSDCIKLFKNNALNEIKLGVVFSAKKGYNKKSGETFLYNIEYGNTNTTI